MPFYTHGVYTDTIWSLLTFLVTHTKVFALLVCTGGSVHEYVQALIECVGWLGHGMPSDWIHLSYRHFCCYGKIP